MSRSSWKICPSCPTIYCGGDRCPTCEAEGVPTEVTPQQAYTAFMESVERDPPTVTTTHDTGGDDGDR